MMPRHYPVTLPYTLPAFEVDFAIMAIQRENLWHKLPRPVQAKLRAAHDAHSDLTITKADLDSLSDDVWAFVRGQLPQQRGK